MHKHASARAAWKSQPLLEYAYGDFQSFEENYRAARSEVTGRALGWLEGRVAGFADERDEAQARAAKANRPLSAKAESWSPAQLLGNRLTLWLYGPVADICKSLCEALDEHHDAACVILRIDSPGGWIHTGLRLSNALLQHRGKKLAIVDRSCWSSAVLAATACDRVHIRRNATMMIHRSSCAVAGDAEDLLEAVARCRATDAASLQFIARRRPRVCSTRLRNLRDREHYMGAEEAIEVGLADRVLRAR